MKGQTEPIRSPCPVANLVRSGLGLGARTSKELKVSVPGNPASPLGCGLKAAESETSCAVFSANIDLAFC